MTDDVKPDDDAPPTSPEDAAPEDDDAKPVEPTDAGSTTGGGTDDTPSGGQ